MEIAEQNNLTRIVEILQQNTLSLTVLNIG